MQKIDPKIGREKLANKKPRKARCDSVLAHLPIGQRTELIRWLMGEGIAYTEAAKRLSERFGVVIRSLKSLSAFWDRECAPLIVQRRREPVRVELHLFLHLACKDGTVDIHLAAPEIRGKRPSSID